MGSYEKEDDSVELAAKYFKELTAEEVYEILKERSAVFVIEQKCIYQDIDSLDYEAMHVFYKRGRNIAAYLRIFRLEEDMVQIGRVLTVERGVGLGARVLNEGIRIAKEEMGAKRIYIEAQSYAKKFYERAGFIQISEEFLEDNIPHIKMILEN